MKISENIYITYLVALNFCLPLYPSNNKEMKNTTTKKQRKAAFKNYLRTVASSQMSSGCDTFQCIENSLMKVLPNGLTVRQYLMKYDKKDLRHRITALGLNLRYFVNNKLEYGQNSWLNCNDTY